MLSLYLLMIKSVSRSCDSVISDITVTEDGVLKLLKNIQTAKAPGPDSIPNHVLKECASELAPSITLLFQKSLDTGCLPRDWLNANIAPVFKKGDRHLPENYRPVSLTSVLSKGSVTIVADFSPEFNLQFHWRSEPQPKNHRAYQ